MREVFYTYSASGIPADPDENSTKYTGALPYANGYYKAIAKEDNDWSTVTSKGFGMSPTDYVHYYPLTADFNDHAGVVNITSSATITSNGAHVGGAGQMLNLNSAINLTNFTVSMYLTIDSGENDGGIICTNNNNYGYALFRDAALKSWDGGGICQNPNIAMKTGVEYHLTLTKNGNQCQWFLNETMSPIMTQFDIVIGGFAGIIGFAGYECLGLYKEIKIFNRVLTQNEINSL